MNKLLKYSTFFLLLLFSSQLFSQNLKFPKILLTDIEIPVEISNIEEDVDTVNLIVKSENWQETFYSKVDSSHSAIVKIRLPQSGGHNFMIYESTLPSIGKEVYPGWFSLIPPILAIILALVFRQVLVALFAGIYTGLLFLYDFNPITAFLRLIDTNIFNALYDPDHIYIILFTLLIGGVVGVISRNGGTEGLANKITKFAKTPRSGMLSTWFMGILIFFDDYSNSLIIGNMMRPITDKLKISREKLAYIVDSTAAPIASLMIISTWIGYELGLIGEGLKIINSTQNPYEIFFQTLPYRFYPIAALFFVVLVSITKRDFGPMLKAELTAKKTSTIKIEKTNLESAEKGKWFNAAIPIAIILFGTIAGLIYTGIASLEDQNIYHYGLREIISNSDSYSALIWASLVASVIAILLTFGQKIRKLEQSLNDWQGGVQSMMIAVIILTLAWGISSITNQLYTADYLISILSDSINPNLFPAIVFVACGFISFATGTSWGTMAIVMPIVIPMSVAVISAGSGLDQNLLLVGVISSVLAGSVWGDHCSPIADTTILSSMASECDHISHVKTQLPYALLVGGVSVILGDIPTAYGLNPYISIILIMSVLTGILLLVGKKVES